MDDLNRVELYWKEKGKLAAYDQQALQDRSEVLFSLLTYFQIQPTRAILAINASVLRVNSLANFMKGAIIS